MTAVLRLTSSTLTTSKPEHLYIFQNELHYLVQVSSSVLENIEKGKIKDKFSLVSFFS